jgi:hypothetical protein
MKARLRIGAVLVAALAGLALIVVMIGRQPRPTDIRTVRQSRLDRLRSVPYTTVTPDVVDTSQAGVTLYKPGDASEGYNLYCLRNLPEVDLMDMEGNIVHRWTYGRLGPYGSIHAAMLGNGDLIVLARTTSVISLVKLAWDSRQIWKIDVPAHHEIAFLPDGSFYTYLQDVIPYRGLNVDFSAICLFSADGVELQRWPLYDKLDQFKSVLDRGSLLDTVLDSIYAAGDSVRLVEGTMEDIKEFRKKWRRRVYDYFHPNAITILPDTPLGRRDSRFRAGNLLVCFRNQNQILVLDSGLDEVLWVWGEKVLEWPHDPTMLENGNILVFNNGVKQESSTVIELDPVTGEIQWQYGTGPAEHFYSYSKGSAQRLPNGNTLICDSDNGRAFEVTHAKDMVWEWLGPVDESSHRVQIYRMERLAPDLVEPLLNRAASQIRGTPHQ